MADHTALPTWVERVGDLLAWIRKHLPAIVQTVAVAVGWIAAGVLFEADRQHTAAVVAVMGGLFSEALVITWRLMYAAWPTLHELPGKDRETGG